MLQGQFWQQALTTKIASLLHSQFCPSNSINIFGRIKYQIHIKNCLFDLSQSYDLKYLPSQRQSLFSFMSQG